MQILTGEDRMAYIFQDQLRAYCEKHGHDWAFKDEGKFMVKICLVCGCKQAFFPEEVDE